MRKLQAILLFSSVLMLVSCYGYNIYRYGVSHEVDYSNCEEIIWTMVIRNGSVGSPPPRNPEVVIWDGEEMLIYGGVGTKEEKDIDYADLWAYNPKTNKWRELKPKGPNPPSLTSPVADWSGKELFLFGGKVQKKYLEATADLWIYNKAENSWQVINPNSSNWPPPCYGDYGRWFNGRFIILMNVGYPRRDDKSNPEEYYYWSYDPVKNEWTKFLPKGECPILIDWPYKWYTSVWAGNKLLIFIGPEALEGYIDYFWIYDLEKNEWEKKVLTGPRPTTRGGAMAVWNGKEVLLYGGHIGAAIGGNFARDFLIYNLENNSFRRIKMAGDVPSPPRYTPVVWDEEKGILFGGSGFKGGIICRETRLLLNDTYIFRLKTLK